MLNRRALFFSFVDNGGFFDGSTGLGQQVRGVDSTEILVGQTGPQTGPAALWGSSRPWIRSFLQRNQ